MLIGIIFFILTIIVAVATPFILKYQRQRMLEGKYKVRSNNDTDTPKQDKKSKSKGKNLKDIWNIKDIQNGIIITNDNHYRMIIRMGSLDYYLMSHEEQTGVEDVMMGMAKSLNSSIQLYTTTELVDTKYCIAGLYSQLNNPNLSAQMRAYISNTIEFLNDMALNRAVHNRKSYVVISLNETKDFPKAAAELYRRAETIIAQLSKSGIRCEILDTNGVTDLLFRFFNRFRTVNPSDLVMSGGMSLLKEGAGGRVVFDAGEDIQTQEEQRYESGTRSNRSDKKHTQTA